MEIRIDLVPLPLGSAARPTRAQHAATTVVVDVLRAGTIAAHLLGRGAAAVTVTPSVRAARQYAAAAGALLVGDVRGVPPEGFNHPATARALRTLDCVDREVVLLTDDAAEALAAADGRRLLAGFGNAVAVAEAALASDPKRVCVVCAGERGQPDLADTVAAGVLITLLERGGRRRGAPPLAFAGAARYCLSVLRTIKDPLDALWASSAGSELRSAGLEEDVAFASEIGGCAAVPAVERVEEAFGRPLVRLVSTR